MAGARPVTWLDRAACGGQDQADNLTPPSYRETWRPADAAVIVAALGRCSGCTVTAECLADALSDKRNGANGGLYLVPQRQRCTTVGAACGTVVEGPRRRLDAPTIKG